MAFVTYLENVPKYHRNLLTSRTGITRVPYCGIEEVDFLFMGEWSDPYLGYEKYAINEPMATNGLYSMFCEETGLDDLDSFASWLKDNKELLFESLENLIDYYRKEGEIV